MSMDPRIGATANGKFYAFVNGYDQPEVCGTLNEVEAALGISSAIVAPNDDRYTVTLRFQFPAWDEVEGIVYEDIRANSKSDAISYARIQAWSDGHTGRGKGRYTFTAELED